MTENKKTSGSSGGQPVRETARHPRPNQTEGYTPVEKGYTPQASSETPVPPQGGTGLVTPQGSQDQTSPPPQPSSGQADAEAGK